MQLIPGKIYFHGKPVMYVQRQPKVESNGHYETATGGSLSEQLQTRTLENNNSDLHLVLLPGLDGTGKLFDPFIRQFPDPSRISVIPYPMDRHLAFEQLVEHSAALLPAGKPLAVLGESYSGPVALRLAARADIHVQKVILVASFAKYPASMLKSLSRWLPLSLLFRLPIPDSALRYFCFGGAGDETLRTLLRDSLRANNPKVLAMRAHDGSRVDVTEALASITAPCLYIAAGNDKLVPGSAIDYLKNHLPAMEVIVIDGAHFILQVRPQACFDAVYNFLYGNVGRPAA
jgi:pimeloyl-ACP methyl ester carboxylesterase